MTSDLNIYRKKVNNTLGSNIKTYLGLMGSWFRGKLTKDEFDQNARSLFTDDTVRTHNEFLLAMLQKCQSVVASSMNARDTDLRNQSLNGEVVPPPPPLQRQKSSKKKPYVKANFSQRFQPANQLMQVQRTHLPPSTDYNKLSFLTREHSLLPNPAMIQGRIYVSAWEAGLENVQSDIYSLVSLATEVILKNIISHVISKRSGFRTMDSKRFKYNAGLQLPVVFQHHSNDEQSSQAKGGDLEQDDAFTLMSLARAGPWVLPNTPITAHDMFVAMQADPEVLASHTIYNLTMERISSRIYHNDNEELLAKTNPVDDWQPQAPAVTKRLLTKAPSQTHSLH